MAGEGGWDQAGAAGFGDRKLKNTLPVYGNKSSMNINSMILTNILGSPYFKEELINYKTFHEVVDEIFYKVEHLEPWEKNSRRLAGQVGMCAGVRGVAAGGIVSTAFCLLYKLFTLKLTRKQLTAMLNHRDSPYIRGIGFMYVRYCQPPADFWDWFSPYLDDEEEIDLKAGSGYTVKIGEVCHMMLSKLDWFGTLFPRLPVNTQKGLEAKLKEFKMSRMVENNDRSNGLDDQNSGAPEADEWGEAGRRAREEIRNALPVRDRSRERQKSRSRSRDQSRSPKDRPRRSRSRGRRSHSKDRPRKSRSKGRRSHSKDRPRKSRSRGRRSHSKDRPRKSRSRDRLRRSRSQDRQKRSRSKDRRRSKSPFRDRSRRSRSRDRPRRSRSGDRPKRSRSTDRPHSRDKKSPRSRRSRSPLKDRQRKSRSRERQGSRERRKSRSLSQDRKKVRSHSGDRARKSHRSRSRSKDRQISRIRGDHSRKSRSLSQDRKRVRSHSGDRARKSHRSRSHSKDRQISHIRGNHSSSRNHSKERQR